MPFILGKAIPTESQEVRAGFEKKNRRFGRGPVKMTTLLILLEFQPWRV